ASIANRKERYESGWREDGTFSYYISHFTYDGPLDGLRMKRQSFDILKSQRKATDNGPKKGKQPMDIRQEQIGPLAKENEEKGNTSRRG
ncbi:UNVERIFIED_CONTAM: hypothetical protein Sindi_3048300, partial [Sesamum indicum]